MTYEEIKDWLHYTIAKSLVSLDLKLDEIKRLKSYLQYSKRLNICKFFEFCNLCNDNLKLGLEFKDENDYDKIFPALHEVEEKILIDKKLSLSIMRSLKSDFKKGVDDLAFFIINLINSLGIEFKHCGDIIIKLLKANYNQVKSGKLRKFGLTLPNIREYEITLYHALEEQDVKTFKAIFSNYIEELLANETIQELLAMNNADNLLIKIKFYTLLNYLISEYFKEAKIEAKIATEDTLPDTDINEYISNGKVIKVCSHEALANILTASNVSKAQQEEYLKQLTNLIAREEVAVKEAQKNAGLNRFLSSREIEVYNLGKMANSIEASQLIKDIDALLELCSDVTEEEQIELVNEIQLYISYLQDLVVKKELKKEEIPQVIYYKEPKITSSSKVINETSVPLLAKEIAKVEKSTYKSIQASLTKIIEGNTANDRLLMGDKLPLKIWSKGKDFLIFYAVINNVTCIISGYPKAVAYQEILKVVNSRAFLEYLELLKEKIKKEVIFDEKEYTESMISTLSSNKSRK